MTWRGLVTLGFVGLSAAVIALYWVQGRRVTRVVPYLGLLSRAKSAVPAGRWLRFISQPLSLLAQLGLLLVLAIGLWQRKAAEEAPRVSTWLVDVGITMQTQSAERPGTSRIDLAKERLLERIRQLGEDEWVSLILVGAKPELQVGFTQDKAQLRQAVASLQAEDGRANFVAAVELAEATSKRRPFEIVVFGDPPGGELKRLAPSAEAMRRDVALSLAPSPNLSIESFAARRYPLGAGKFEVSLAVHSAATTRTPVRATLYAVSLPSGAEAPQDVAEFVVEAGAVARHTFAHAAGPVAALSCHIERLDGQAETLQKDNVARAILPDARPFSVLVVGDESLFLTAALLASADVRLERVGAPEYPVKDSQGEPRHFDLTIFRELAPLGPVPQAALYLGSKGPGAPVQMGKTLQSFGFDEADRSRKLFRFFDPYDTQVLHGHALVLGPQDQALAWTGKLPLVGIGVRGRGRFLSLGFAPEDSDMVLRSAFPLFIRGVLEELVEEDSPKWQVPGRAGEKVELQVAGASISSPLELVGPLRTPWEERRSAWANAGRVAWTLERAGFYEVQKEGQHQQYFAVNPAAAGRSTPGPGLPLLPGHRSWPPRWQGLVLAAAVLMLAEYYSFHRKWTV